MATYYSSSAVEQLGRRLEDKDAYTPPDEVKIAITDNGLWRIASNDVQEAYRMYAEGEYLSLHIYAVPKNSLAECVDGGREKSTYSRHISPKTPSGLSDG